MKKALAILLALTICLSLLAACNGGDKPSGSSQPPATQAPSGSNPTQAPDDVPTEPIELKFGCTGTEGSFQALSAKTFKEQLEEISGGMITVQLNLGGVLGNTLSHYSQMGSGDLDFFMGALDTASGLKDGGDLAVVLVPFLFDDEEHYQKFLDSDLFSQLVAPVEAANGITWLGDLTHQMPRGLSTKTPV